MKIPGREADFLPDFAFCKIFTCGILREEI